MKYKSLGRVEIYSKMLSIQAKMAYPFERPFFENQYWQKSKTVFDFGCGNAEYLKILADEFPEKTYWGCEIDDEMREIAIQNVSHYNNIKIISPNQIDIISDVDFFIYRLVLLHVPIREDAYSIINKIGSIDKVLLVIDADDEFFTINPEPKSFIKILENLRNKNVDRNLLLKIDSELEKFDLKSFYFFRIIINNRFPHAGDEMFKYMFYTAELSAGENFSMEDKTELLDWFLNKRPYVQYGIFGKLYK